jgi:WD40 repeat protein
MYLYVVHVAVCAGHEGKVTGLALLPNDLVLSCSEDRSLRIWDLKSMKQLHVSTEACAGRDTSACVPHTRSASCCKTRASA